MLLTVLHILFLFESRKPRCTCSESHFYYLNLNINDMIFIFNKTVKDVISKYIPPEQLHSGQDIQEWTK